MLCVTVKLNERLQIGDAVVVFRGAVTHGARLGIEAPPHIVVVRESAKNKRPKPRRVKALCRRSR